jgi:Xaa-Pro aminopeptidase
MALNARPMLTNVERLYKLMDEERLAAIVARSGQNVTYLSGVVFPGTLQRHLDFADSERGVLVIWPRSGEPVIVANLQAEDLCRRDGWIKNVELYRGYAESPYEAVFRALKNLGLEAERVGFEQDYVNARDWEFVQKRLPKLSMVDCKPMMDRVRWIKTEGEVALLKRAADLLDTVHEEVFSSLRVGDTEREAHSKMIYRCLKRGAGWAHGILHESKNTVSYGGESDTIFNPGDVIRTDYVAYLEGYPGHQSRVAVFGEPSAAQRAEFTTYRDIYRATIDRCRPGATAGSIYQFASDEMAKVGRRVASTLVGHGVGPWWHQQMPILAKDSPVPLEEGMALALEPRWGYWGLQDMVVVRKGAPQMLSDKFNTDSPFVVNG